MPGRGGVPREGRFQSGTLRPSALLRLPAALCVPAGRPDGQCRTGAAGLRPGIDLAAGCTVPGSFPGAAGGGAGGGQGAVGRVRREK
jgi:hypothetical protein